jgi:hypothetical protein
LVVSAREQEPTERVDTARASDEPDRQRALARARFHSSEIRFHLLR